MISPYALRLACLSLACFFLLNLTVGLGVAAASHPILRIASRRSPRDAARILLWMRLFPSALAISIVALLCVPSYLYLEPHFDTESIGVLCGLAAILGAALLCAAVVRTMLAIVRSTRMLRHWKRTASPLRIAGATCLQVPAGRPVIALAGLFRSRLLVSSDILETLAVDELELAISHERAHAASADNWKRLLFALAPDAAPFLKIYGSMERGWAKFTEWAADEAAAQGDLRRSLSLAAALVRVARMTSGPELPAAMSPLVADRAGLAERVERLLSPVAVPMRKSSALLLTAVASTTAIVAALCQPAMLSSVHEILEHLIH